jgi:endonuclease/exonuclease/phosphatase family metal-dependent hydrolase
LRLYQPSKFLHSVRLSIGVIVAIPLFLSTAGCPGSPDEQNGDLEPNTWTIPSFGSDSTLEVMTWNLRNFGQNGSPPIHRVAEIVRQLDVDVIALQEIVSQSAFETLLDSLDGWTGFRASPSSTWQELAYLYKDSLFVQVAPAYEIYVDEDRALPREPLVLELLADTLRIVLINNHLKCCGNGTIEDDPDDEETRREAASLLLQDYIQTQLPEQNVILLGDLNDEIDEPSERNVFQNLLEANDQFYFVTLALVQDTTQATYPHAPWFSFIDHILITTVLLDEWERSGHVETIRLDDMMDGYFGEVSDHRPVAMRLAFR